MDVIAVYEAAGEAIDRARRGEGPTLLECKTYRYYDHVGVRGMGIAYRSKDEVEEWKQRDAIRLLEGQLAEQDVLSTDAAAAIHERVRAEALEAIEWAEASPYPAVDDLLADVYYDGN
jgi:TPP-dependent pyruvate/acetoin dehydrogenase alpha subunit